MLDSGQSLGSHGAPRKPIGPRSTVKDTRDKNTREKGTANDIFFWMGQAIERWRYERGASVVYPGFAR